MAMDWLKAQVPLLIVYYEDLRTHPIRELIRMVKFLNQPINLTRIQCALLGHPLREHDYWFRKALRGHMIAQRYTMIVNETLLKFNVRPLPNYYTTTIQ